MERQYLTEINELADILYSNNLVIIDTREPDEYKLAHIPGSINIYDIFKYLSTEETGGYPTLIKHFAELFGQAGIDGNERVVVYEDAMDNGYGRSCRGCFILSYLGHKNVSVLHGGFQGWLNANKPINAKTPNPEVKYFIPQIDSSIILNKEEMLNSIQNPDILIIDCRDHSEWVAISSSPYGPDFAPRKGRIPNAKWLEWYNTMTYRDSIPWFKTSEELREVFQNAGITQDSKVHIYCFKGARTSNMFIAMKLAGIKYVRNYLGSWNEWSRDNTLPIDKGYPRN